MTHLNELYLILNKSLILEASSCDTATLLGLKDQLTQLRTNIAK